MASEAKNIVESARVRVQPRLPSASSSAPPEADTREVRDGEVNCDHARFLLQNHANFRSSASPARLLYFSGDGSWLDLPLTNEVFDSLKLAFGEGRPMTDASVDGARYLFDFLCMVQVNLETGDQRLIAWIDQNGKCFFPQTFPAGADEAGPEEPENVNKIKVEFVVDGNLIQPKKEGPEKEAEMNWSKQPERPPLLALPDAGSSRWPNTRKLREGEMVFSIFKDFFLAGIKKTDPGAAVTAIYQFDRTGHLGKARHDVFEKQIELTRIQRGASNMVYAWHGAPAQGVEGILAHGFRALSNIPLFGYFGSGVYLSPLGLPHMSARFAEVDGNGEKHVILCRVVLGNVEKVQAGSRRYYPSSVDFDNAVDDFVNPTWYVVWASNMNSHVIPECVLSFKPSNVIEGQVKRSICRVYDFEHLFTRLRDQLPPAKFREVVNFYDLYKNGKMAKNTFFQHMRRIAGDEMVMSAIRDIQCPT